MTTPVQEQTDVVQKWTNTGFLRGIKPQHLQRAAERLEAANRSTTGGHSRDALDNELRLMTREGYFGGQVNSIRGWR